MFLSISGELPVGEEYIDPYLYFQRADSALAAISRVHYRFSFTGTGALANIIPTVSGETWLYSIPGVSHPVMVLSYNKILHGEPWRFVPVPSTYIASPDTLYRIDHLKRVIRAGDLSIQGVRVFDYPPAFILMEFVMDNPFGFELDGDSIAVLYPDTVNGVFCHVFQVYRDQLITTWSLGVDDLLPRAVERGEFSVTGDELVYGGQRLVIEELETAFVEDFQLILPSGYQRPPRRELISSGSPAPDIFLADIDGFTRRISYPASSPVLICFFSSQQPRSMAALGTLSELQDLHRDELDIYGISVMEESDPVFRLSSLEIEFPLLLFGEQSAETFGVTNIPSFILISADGSVMHSETGISEELPGIVAQMLVDN